MKILFVTNGYPTKNHPEYCVFTKDQIEGVLATKEIEGEVFFINAREKGIFEYVRVIFSLQKKIKEADIVHAFHGLSLLLVFFIAPQKKIIISFLNSLENEYGENKILSKPLEIITKKIIHKRNITKIFKDKIPPKYDKNSYYLPNGVDTNKFYPMDKLFAKKYLNLDFRKKYILFVSSKDKHRKQKRYDRFHRVIEILKKDSPDIEELVLVNETRERVVYYFNAAELHLLTSDFEGSPNSIKESIACNTPVVTTNTGNIERMIKNIENCYISKTFEPEELATYCTYILKRPLMQVEIRKYLFMRGLDSRTKTIDLLNIYNSLL